MPVIKEAKTPYISQAGPQPIITAVSTPYIKQVNTYAIPPTLQAKYDTAAYYSASDGLDATGNGNNLTEVGTVTIASGPILDAWQVSTGGNYWLLSDNNYFNFTGSFHIDFWFGPLVLTGANVKGILMKGLGTSAATLQYSLWCSVNQGRKIVFDTSDGATKSSLVSDVVLEVGNWYYVAASYDAAAGKKSLSVNNSTPVEQGADQPQVTAGNLLQCAIAGGFVEGRLAEVGYVKDDLLTAAMRTQRYCAGAPTDSYPGFAC